MSDRYEILGRLGKGGIGQVYRALDTFLERQVAIKRLLPEGESEALGVTHDALQREAATLSHLQHPNIVSIYDLTADEEGYFVVMELIEGKTLDEFLLTEPGQQMNLQDFQSFVLQCLEAMIAAQSLDLLHRDIKPQNIMIQRLSNGGIQTKVLDFGLAKFSSQPALQTVDQTDSILGSIYFLAPEQFERIPLDKRTDLYALGCVFYNALTGKYPFDGETPSGVMESHLDHRVTPLHQLRPDLGQSGCDWVMRLISRKMEDRPVDAIEALSTWNAVVIGEPMRTSHYIPPPKIQHPVAPAIPIPVRVATSPHGVQRSTGKVRPVTGQITRSIGSRTGALGTRTGVLNPGSSRVNLSTRAPLDVSAPPKDRRTLIILIVLLLLIALMVWLTLFVVKQSKSKEPERRVIVPVSVLPSLFEDQPIG